MKLEYKPLIIKGEAEDIILIPRRIGNTVLIHTPRRGIAENIIRRLPELYMEDDDDEDEKTQAIGFHCDPDE